MPHVVKCFPFAACVFFVVGAADVSVSQVDAPLGQPANDVVYDDVDNPDAVSLLQVSAELRGPGTRYTRFDRPHHDKKHPLHNHSDLAADGTSRVASEIYANSAVISSPSGQSVGHNASTLQSATASGTLQRMLSQIPDWSVLKNVAASVSHLRSEGSFTSGTGSALIIVAAILLLLIVVFCMAFEAFGGSGGGDKPRVRQRLLERTNGSLASAVPTAGTLKPPPVMIGKNSPMLGRSLPPSSLALSGTPSGTPPMNQMAGPPLSSMAGPTGLLSSMAPIGASSPIARQISVNADVALASARLAAPRQAPPMVCPALVLPHCEAWFSVAVERLIEGPGSFDVLGLSGNPLLRAKVLHTPNGRGIEISMTPQRSPTLASIIAPAQGGASPAGLLEVRGAGGRLYGQMRPSMNGAGYTLMHGEQEALRLVQDPVSGQLLLQSPGDHEPVASTMRITNTQGAELVEIRVSPGVDAVLVLLCVLAVALFGGGSMLPSKTPRSGGPW